jgi:hypothetical protein
MKYPPESWILDLKEGQLGMVNGWYCGRFEEVGDTKVVDGCQGLVIEESSTGSRGS